MRRRGWQLVTSAALGGFCALAMALLPVDAAPSIPMHPTLHLRHHVSITVQLSVSGTQPWTDSGITLSAGTAVNIAASGTINFGAGHIDGPAGDSSRPTDETYIAPNLTAGSLIVRIGSGLPFEVGVGRTFVAKVAGRLALGDNDSYYGDNSGSWTATVNVRA